MSSRSKKRAKGVSPIDGSKVATQQVRTVVAMRVNGNKIDAIVLDDGSVLGNVNGVKTMQHNETGVVTMALRIPVPVLDVRNVGTAPVPEAVPDGPPPPLSAPVRPSIILTDRFGRELR